MAGELLGGLTLHNKSYGGKSYLPPGRGFRALIEAEPGHEVVGEAADGAEAIELARTAEPNVVLMDIRMPGTNGVAATARSPILWSWRRCWRRCPKVPWPSTLK